jgi:CRISPR-associated endonuclease/helicase Cas3
MSFSDFFRAAAGNDNDPYDYQRRLACGERGSRAENEWLSGGTDCTSRLISIPTGLGKTAAVTLAWLWNRVVLGNESWPRRLVYCLPMRTLVEQTRDEIHCWLDTLANKYTQNSGLAWLVSHSPVILMGGEENDAARREWDIHPEKSAIFIGTQDMLLSRALNRGYGMSRARWPMHFGLLNNDCLWVLDETQLMGAGVGTAAQLEALRNEFKTFPSSGSPSVTWYVSATQNRAQLETREWRGKTRPDDFFFSLSESEKAAATGRLAKRRLSRKHLELHEDWNFADASLNDRAEEILTRHRDMIAKLEGAKGGLPRCTLIICNTVKRAMAVHSALGKAINGGGESLLLLHSRFRQREREARRDSLSAPILPQGQIVVSTQVIEAGVDLSSAILWTEIAPLASLVQRLGRLNRAGEFDQCPDVAFAPQCIVVGLDWKPVEGNKEQKKKVEGENAKKCLPYIFDACQGAWETLRTIPNRNASPAAFEEPGVAAAVAASIPEIPYSLQRHELLDFFDTDANLSLGFTDVSPFVRGFDEDTDLLVLWRDDLNSDGTIPANYLPDFQRQELCAVSIGQAKAVTKLLNKGWLWRGKEAGWASVRACGLLPGMTILLPTTAGGYSTTKGWTGDETDKPDDVHLPRKIESDEDLLSAIDNGWQDIAGHTADVRQDFSSRLAALLPPDEQKAVLCGIDWHDIGKNHKKWREAAKSVLEKAGIAISSDKFPLAKFSLSDSPQLSGFTGDGLKRKIRELKRSFRPGIAHEVASALAFRQHEIEIGVARSFGSLLAEYLIMSHHGHVRKTLRDELPRHPKDAKDTETVRGIRQGDKIDKVEISGQQFGCENLSTDCRRMGRDAAGNESYTRGVLHLLTYYGPFRLAFLEAVFRASDWHASAAIGNIKSQKLQTFPICASVSNILKSSDVMLNSNTRENDHD